MTTEKTVFESDPTKWVLVMSGGVHYLVLPNDGATVHGGHDLAFQDILYVHAQPLIVPSPQGVGTFGVEIIAPLMNNTLPVSGHLVPSLVIPLRTLSELDQERLRKLLHKFNKNRQQNIEQTERELKISKELAGNSSLILDVGIPRN
jgi:hypothetical protein